MDAGVCRGQRSFLRGLARLAPGVNPLELGIISGLGFVGEPRGFGLGDARASAEAGEGARGSGGLVNWQPYACRMGG